MTEKIVFLHGLGQSSAAWNGVFEYFDGIGEFCCPDLVKMCGSPADYKTLFRAFSEYCSNLGEPLNLVGLSLGGMLALNYAAENPEAVRSLVLIGTQYKSPKAMLKLQNVILKIMPKASFAETGFDKRNFISLANSMAELDFSEKLQNVSCPALVLIGARDKPNRKAALELSRLINGAVFAEIKNVAHEVNRDAPEQLAETVKRFNETEHII